MADNEYEFDGAPIMMLLDLFRDQGVEAFVAQTMNDIHTRLYALGAAYCILGRDDRANLGALFAMLADESAHFQFPLMSKGFALIWRTDHND